MRYFLLPLFILLFTKALSQDVQQVEVLKNDKHIFYMISLYLYMIFVYFYMIFDDFQH